MWEAIFYIVVGGASVVIYRDAVRPWLMAKAGLRQKCNECDFEVTADKPGVAHSIMVDHKRGHIT